MKKQKRGQNGKKKQGKRAGITVVRNNKDTIFRMLYSDKKELLALYNAVNGGNYTDPEQLRVMTLEHAVYMSMKNDVSFILDTRLSLYEHQSTLCPNMPLRDLMYVAEQFTELTVNQDIYGSRLIRLPSPRFITFYNGKRPQPERLEQRLSDAYETREDAVAEMPNLELRVLQLNINPGYNEELKQKCPTLLQYTQYVERVRKYEQTMPLRKAVETAVEECIRENILRDFLLREKARAIRMSIYEFDQELHDKTIRRESWEDSRELHVTELICRNKQLGRSVSEIAEFLGEDLANVQKIYDAAN